MELFIKDFEIKDGKRRFWPLLMISSHSAPVYFINIKTKINRRLRTSGTGPKEVNNF